MTLVKIKLKGQFYGMTGEIVKRQNQYLFGIKFPNLKGVYSFRGRCFEIIDTPMIDIESEVLKSTAAKINGVIHELQAMAKSTELHLEHSKKYHTDWAKATVKALEKELQDKREIIQMLRNLIEGQ
jgi:hypothetical protein